jgi:hypothetical protein
VSMACWSRYKFTPQASRCWIQRAAQAGNRPCHDDIEFPSVGVLEHGLAARLSVSSLGARHARIGGNERQLQTGEPPSVIGKPIEKVEDC